MAHRLEGKVAIVTGAAQGIGRTIVEMFAQEGAAVAIADLQDEKGREVSRQLTAGGAAAIFEACDVTSRDSVEAMTAAVIERLGPPDVLVNNAGVAVFADPLEMTQHDWQQCFSVDLDGVWNGCRAVLPHMLKKGKGDIINIASTHSFKIIPHCFPYPVAKHAVVGLTRALAIEYADRNIRVNAIAPGYTDTEIVAQIFERTGDAEAARRQTNLLVPVKRIGRPAEIAWTAVFLASDEARFITAETIVIDGGRSVLFHE